MTIPASLANRGSALEDLLARQHALYEARGVAWVRKHPTPWTPTRRGGKVVGGRPTGFATADFLGVLAGGRGVALEAKECGAPSFPWSRIPPQQRGCLDAYQDAGAVAAVVLWWGPDPKAPAQSPRRARDERWAVPWSRCRASIAVGKRSLAWYPGAPYRVTGPGLCPWLETLGVV